MARIAVGGFQHETNTFAPQRASWADFERADAWPGFIRGPELIPAVHGYNIPIAGAVEALQQLGHELVPLCWCSAPPSSYVERDAYEKPGPSSKTSPRRAPPRAISTASISTCTARWSPSITRTARASCCAASAP